MAEGAIGRAADTLDGAAGDLHPCGLCGGREDRSRDEDDPAGAEHLACAEQVGQSTAQQK